MPPAKADLPGLVLRHGHIDIIFKRIEDKHSGEEDQLVVHLAPRYEGPVPLFVKGTDQDTEFPHPVIYLFAHETVHTKRPTAAAQLELLTLGNFGLSEHTGKNIHRQMQVILEQGLQAQG